MAIEAYLWFLKYDGTFLDSESQVDVSRQAEPPEITFPPATTFSRSRLRVRRCPSR